jgi:hypothetical protein
MEPIQIYTALHGLSAKDMRIGRLPKGYCYLALVPKDMRRICGQTLGPQPSLSTVRPWLSLGNSAAWNQVSISFTRKNLLHARFTNKVAPLVRASFLEWFAGTPSVYSDGLFIGSSEPQPPSNKPTPAHDESHGHASFGNDPWTDLSGIPKPPEDIPGFEIYDEEFDYLHLFDPSKRHEIARSLGRSPLVDSVYGVDKSLAIRQIGTAHLSSVDSTVVYIGPGIDDLWDVLKKFRNLANPPTLGSRHLTSPPLPTIPGFCYLPLFEFYTQRMVSMRLGAYPTIGQVTGLKSVVRSDACGVFTQSRRTVGFFHFDVVVDTATAWPILESLAKKSPQQLIGADEQSHGQPDVLEEDISQDGSFETPPSGIDPETHVPLITETNIPAHHRNASFAGPELSRPEEINVSPLCDDGTFSMDIPGTVTERFENGFCYLGLFFPSNRDKVREFFGPSPRISELLKTPEENRFPAVGVIMRTLKGPAKYHASFETRGVNLWRDLTRILFEDAEATLGSDEQYPAGARFFEYEDYEPVPEPERDVIREYEIPFDFVRFFGLCYRQFYFFFSRTLVCLFFILTFRGFFVDWLQTYFTLIVLLSSLLSALIFDVCFGRLSYNLFRLIPSPVASFVISGFQFVDLYAKHDPLLNLLFVLGRLVHVFISMFVLWRHVAATVGLCRFVRDFMIWTTDAMMNSMSRMMRGRTYQSSGTPLDRWLKTILQLFASFLRTLACGSVQARDRTALNKVASSISTIASSVDLPRSINSLWAILKERLNTPVSESNVDVVAEYDLPDTCFLPTEIEEMASPPNEGSERTFQADDDFGFPNVRHLVTKGNISTIADKIEASETGLVHIITAATGTGKSTAIPYYLSSVLDGDVYVVIPTIAACRSAAQVVNDRFGVKPHVKAESIYTEGNCNIWIVTAKTMVAKMVHQPDTIRRISAFVFDEMHEPTPENDLFRKLSPSLARMSRVLWCSATFAQSFTLPGDLMFPVVERIDATVTLDKIFTSKCRARGVTRDTVVGRYLIFCASVRDTRRVVQRFEGSKILAFSIHSGNFSVVISQIERALRDSAIKTVIVASTPCFETGVTLPFNYVVDLGERIVPRMTYDPCALSTQRVPITKGSSTQRKGRVGRLFRGIYIAPPIKFSSTLAIDESGLSLAFVYSRLFGVPPPPRSSFPFLSEQKLTDSFLKNVFSTRLDPIAVAGMTTPEGRIFKSFEQFDYPTGADRKLFVFTDAYFPQDLWATWPSFETASWSMKDNKSGKTLTGTSVRAPFWDYTVDEKVQINNWQIKVLCYPNLTMSDPRYSQSKYMSTTIADNLAKSWLYQGIRPVSSRRSSQHQSSLSQGRSYQSDDFETARRLFADYCGHSARAQQPGARNLATSAFNLPRWVIKRTFADADWLFLVSFFFVVVAYFVLVYYFYKAIFSIVSMPFQQDDATSSKDDAMPRVFEREVTAPSGDGPKKPNRPFEHKRRIGRYDLDQLDPEALITVDFEDERETRRVSREDFDLYFDEWMEVGERAHKGWGDNYVTVTAKTRDGRYVHEQMWEGTNLTKRTNESDIGSKAPMYSLRSAKASVVSIGPVGSKSIIANAVVLRTFIFVNTHVLRDCGARVRVVGLRGEFEFTPSIIMEEGDLTVIHLPPGMAGSSSNFSYRQPEPGEKVAIVRFRLGSQVICEPTPSEISYLALDESGAFGYVIQTVAGDCGYPVVATKDGALVGIHSMGGSHTDQANFMTPITQAIIRNLNRRVAQRSDPEPIGMPVPPTPPELCQTGVVSPAEQMKHPITPFEGDSSVSPFDPSVAGFRVLGELKKHVSCSSKLTVDKRAWRIFSGETIQPLMDLTDYCPSSLTMEAYWKDISKHHRSPVLVPNDFFEVTLEVFQAITPWLFEPQELIGVPEVYYEVDKTKSAGPRLTKKKGLYMSEDVSPSFPQLVSACEAIYDVPADEFVAPVWQVAIKDELRDVDRVLALKTRTFMSAPIETVLGNMRYVSAFNARFIDNCLKFPSTLGIDKFHRGWEQLAKYLGTENRIYMSGDGARFDSSVSVAHLSLNCHLRCLSVAPRYRRHIRNLYSETAFTPLVMGDGIVRVKNGGNPSGSLNTSIDNGISLQASVFYAFKEIFGRETSLRYFVDGTIRFVTNGDDLFFSFDKRIYSPGMADLVTRKLLSTGFTYAFDEPSDRLEDHTYLSHGFKQFTFEGQSLMIPVLASNRVVATCLFAKETDAISTHSRYLSAAIHSFPHRNLMPYVLRLQSEFYKEAMLDRPFVSLDYLKRFPLFFPSDMARLYGYDIVGFASETYSHKNSNLSRRFLERTFQAMSLEKEVGETASIIEDQDEGPINEAETTGDVLHRQMFNPPGKTAKFQFVKGMDPTIAGIFSSAVRLPVRDRIVVAKSTMRDIERSVAALRDMLSVDSQADINNLLRDLLVYYGDNSTSEQNPHIFKYQWKETEISFNDIDRCLLPTPRKFWRALADVTVRFLEEHPDVVFHWAEMHGFPLKYRQYGFDCADFASNVPAEARKAIQASKDAALTRSPYNLMRADLKAVGFGGGTVVEQITGAQFGSRGPGRGR